MNSKSAAVEAGSRLKNVAAKAAQPKAPAPKVETPPAPKRGTPAWLHDCIARARDGVFVEIVDLTPALAKTLLTINEENRHLRNRTAQQYQADITAGRWKLNGQTIVIADNGLLNDGQHRCAAVAATGITIPAILVFGVERESRTTLDQGARRKPGDFLSIAGTKNAYTQAAIARALITWEAKDGANTDDNRNVTATQVIDRVMSDAHISEAAEYASHVAARTSKMASGTVIGLCHLILSRVDPVEAKNFLDSVAYGENLKRGQPAYELRERLLSEHEGFKRAGRDKNLALIFRAWNLHRKGQRCTAGQLSAKLPLPLPYRKAGEGYPLDAAIYEQHGDAPELDMA